MDRIEETYLLTSPEVNAVLADNGADLVALLREQGVAVEARFAPDPTVKSDAGEREAVTIILASAALVALVAPAITRIIGTFTRRPVLVTETKAKPLEDSSGNVLRDAQGNPILTWVEEKRFAEPSGAPLDHGTGRVEALGFKIELG